MSKTIAEFTISFAHKSDSHPRRHVQGESRTVAEMLPSWKWQMSWRNDEAAKCCQLKWTVTVGSNSDLKERLWDKNGIVSNVTPTSSTPMLSQSIRPLCCCNTTSHMRQPDNTCDALIIQTHTLQTSDNLSPIYFYNSTPKSTDYLDSCELAILLIPLE